MYDMQKVKYGQTPEPLGKFNIKCNEMMFYLYLPIKMSWSHDFKIPDRLKVFTPLIQSLILRDRQLIDDKYVYLTAKHLYVKPEYVGNREGYHSDGFGTDDINYVWSDKFPTVFCIQPFKLSDDCDISMAEMEQQALLMNERVYGENLLLRLDQSVIHKAPTVIGSGMRTFVKLSISDHKYNLSGNSHNYLFDYKWKMYNRAEVRNHPTLMESDLIKTPSL